MITRPSLILIEFAIAVGLMVYSLAIWRARDTLQIPHVAFWTLARRTALLMGVLMFCYACMGAFLSYAGSSLSPHSRIMFSQVRSGIGGVFAGMFFICLVAWSSRDRLNGSGSP